MAATTSLSIHLLKLAHHAVLSFCPLGLSSSRIANSASIATKRDRQFERQRRRDSVKKEIVALLFKLFELIVNAAQKTRLLGKRPVETVTVE
jgi:hypothetical protein